MVPSRTERREIGTGRVPLWGPVGGLQCLENKELTSQPLELPLCLRNPRRLAFRPGQDFTLSWPRKSLERPTPDLEGPPSA